MSRRIPNGHSIYTTKFVKDALDEANIDANDIDNIMVVNGPGSFTGWRIGVTIAKTYGYLIKKDVTAISSLKSLAISSDSKDTIMSVIQANKNSYYVGIYDSKYDDIIPEKCVKADELLELCNKYHPHVVGVSSSVIGTYKINKQELDILKIVNYYKDKPKVNHHKIVPNYLKLPQAVEAQHD